MSDRTTIDKGYKLRIGELGLYKPLPQNVPQITDDYRAALTWQQGVDGLRKPLVSIEYVENVSGMVKV